MASVGRREMMISRLRRLVPKQRRFLRPIRCMIVLGGLMVVRVIAEPEQRDLSKDGAVEKPSKLLLNFQSTFILQGQPGFRSPYEGQNSLPPGDTVRETFSFDLYAGFRLWRGAELYVQPEFYQGFGFHDTRGIAAFSNGEAYKAGTKAGHVIWPHIMLRQTVGFGGEQEQIEAGLMQLPQKVDVDRLTMTLGRFAVFDQFDNNAYAHDSRGQFLNWALLDAGAFDYAADAFGYTQGVSLELNRKHWALRWGAFLVPLESNGIALDWNIFRHWEQVVEFESRFRIAGHPGKARLLGWVMSANAGSYSETLANPALGEDITLTRRSRISEGLVLNLEQELSKDLGAFVRLGWRNGRSEVWAFTDIDRSLSVGALLKGSSWGREADTFGLAWNLDGLSSQHRDYLAAGGLGPLVGDGRLNYGLESVIETYYDAKLAKNFHAAVDYQFVNHPGYNRDRGPVNIFGLRLHWEFW